MLCPSAKQLRYYAARRKTQAVFLLHLLYVPPMSPKRDTPEDEEDSVPDPKLIDLTLTKSYVVLRPSKPKHE